MNKQTYMAPQAFIAEAQLHHDFLRASWDVDGPGTSKPIIDGNPPGEGDAKPNRFNIWEEEDDYETDAFQIGFVR